MTLRIPAKVLIHVWLYDFYDMTLSTGKQRRHMIRGYILHGHVFLLNCSGKEKVENKQCSGLGLLRTKVPW